MTKEFSQRENENESEKTHIHNNQKRSQMKPKMKRETVKVGQKCDGNNVRNGKKVIFEESIY